MSLITGKCYDPASAVSKATSALLAMTAFDTTNLRLTFTAPANGKVLVRVRCVEEGATTFPQILLGVLDGATVRGRSAPMGNIRGTALATTHVVQEILVPITGLTAGASYTWDAAYGVEIVLASTGIKYGGPDNTTADDAYGGLVFEVWSAPNLLGAAHYDPAVAVNKVTTSRLAMTALDTTNLRLTFTAPTSGIVMARVKGVLHGATTFPQILLGVLDGATVKGRVSPVGGLVNTALATSMLAVEGSFLVTGLTPAASYTWDAAYGVETEVASSGFKYGGPDNATTNDAFGGCSFEVWAQ